MLNIYVSGFEKQSGKTLISAGLAATMQGLSYSMGIYKPIQVGAINMNGFKSSPDLTLIKKIDSNIETQSTYMLYSEESPFVGSYEEGLELDINAIVSGYKIFSKQTDCTIIEGVNSISSPICQGMTELDIIKFLNVPLVLVINPKKNGIDNVISGLKYIKSEGVKMLGVIFNQHNENSENLEMRYYPQIIKDYFNIQVLGSLPDYEDITSLSPETLISDTLNNMNLEDIFGLKIAKLS